MPFTPIGPRPITPTGPSTSIESGASPVPDVDLLLTVHDELVFEVPAARSAEFKQWVKNEMERVHKLDVPLVVEVGEGRTWGAAH